MTHTGQEKKQKSPSLIVRLDDSVKKQALELVHKRPDLYPTLSALVRAALVNFMHVDTQTAHTEGIEPPETHVVPTIRRDEVVITQVEKDKMFADAWDELRREAREKGIPESSVIFEDAYVRYRLKVQKARGDYAGRDFEEVKKGVEKRTTETGIKPH